MSEKREVFKVKVIKAYAKDWYFTSIGKEIEVLESTHKEDSFVTPNGDYIKKDDCQIVKEGRKLVKLTLATNETYKK